MALIEWNRGQQVVWAGADLAAPTQILATADAVYEFAERQSRVRVNNHKDSAANLYVRMNADAATTTGADGWDFMLEPGESEIVGRPDSMIKKVAIYSDKSSAVTYGTDFNVRGMR